MPVPTYDALMLPVLRHCADRLWQMRDLIERISDDLKLSPPERSEQIPSGGATIIASRVAWAKSNRGRFPGGGVALRMAA